MILFLIFGFIGLVNLTITSVVILLIAKAVKRKHEEVAATTWAQIR